MSAVHQAEVEVVEEEKPANGKKPRALVKREDSGLAQRTPDINDLMAQAVATGNMDTIERVFALRQELKREAAKAEFLNALSRFQSIVPKIPKTKKGYNYWYAPLGVIESKINKAMEASGLSKRWRQEETPDSVKMFCVVSHGGGHSEETPIGPVPWDLLERTQQMNGLQHRSSVITYLQRYTLIGALGLATADDDPDGIIPEEARNARQPANHSRQPVRQPQQTPSAQKASGTKAKVDLEPAGDGEETIDANTVKGLTKAMESAALGQSDFIKRYPKLTGLEQVKKADARAVMSWIASPDTN